MKRRPIYNRCEHTPKPQAKGGALEKIIAGSRVDVQAMSANLAEWSRNENWYGPWRLKLFYYASNDSRPFVPSHPSFSSKFYSKKKTLNFANLEAQTWLGALVVLCLYPLTRKCDYLIGHSAFFNSKWMDNSNWYAGNSVYYCRKDPRPFVPRNPSNSSWLTVKSGGGPVLADGP